jgi:hypothetical protein
VVGLNLHEGSMGSKSSTGSKRFVLQRFQGSRFAAEIILGLAVVFGTSCRSHSGSITIANGTSESIARAEMIVCNQRLIVENLKPHDEAFRDYRLNCEGHYSVNVRFESGRQVSKDVGYVTTGMDMHHRLIIDDGDWKFELRTSGTP